MRSKSAGQLVRLSNLVFFFFSTMLKLTASIINNSFTKNDATHHNRPANQQAHPHSLGALSAKAMRGPDPKMGAIYL